MILSEKSFMVVDDFCPCMDDVRRSALAAGFGTWRPSKGEIGSSVYEGMGFWGNHSFLLHSLARAVGKPVFPNTMFFRVTNKTTEKAYVHSDRETGSFTCVAYLSRHADVKSGTGFFRHKRTGLVEMPTFQQIRDMGAEGEKLKRDMVRGSSRDWEQLDFVRGVYNRALIFRAPLFHARRPRNGIGTTAEDGRIVWVTHFEVEEIT